MTKINFVNVLGIPGWLLEQKVILILTLLYLPSKHMDFLNSAQLYFVSFSYISCYTIKTPQKYLKLQSKKLME